MRECHVCARSWSNHAPDCRVHADLERMRRVLVRLDEEDREPVLRARMGSYLEEFGNLPCQREEGFPSQSSCRKCGHNGICVIITDGAAAK